MGDLNSQVNRAVWFDVPVVDLERAAAFYRAVLANSGVTDISALALNTATLGHNLDG